MINSAIHLTWAAKVNYSDSTSFGSTQKDVLRLQVAVDYSQLRRGKEKQSSA
jgi:hypothetical protein